MTIIERRNDPGHGWFGVPMTEIKHLGIAADVSGYSYYDPATRTAWLEEDCDIGVYFCALDKRGLPKPKIREVYESRSSIRPLWGYNPNRPA